MGIFEHIEKTKLLFIRLFSAYLVEGLITEEQFDAILDVLDRLDEISEIELVSILRAITKGGIDLYLWED